MEHVCVAVACPPANDLKGEVVTTSCESRRNCDGIVNVSRVVGLAIVLIGRSRVH